MSCSITPKPRNSNKTLLNSKLHCTALCTESESESYVTTDGQSASLSWYKVPIRGLRPDFVSVQNTEYV
jgi:hypothetical protein